MMATGFVLINKTSTEDYPKCCNESEIVRAQIFQMPDGCYSVLTLSSFADTDTYTFGYFVN